MDFRVRLHYDALRAKAAWRVHEIGGALTRPGLDARLLGSRMPQTAAPTSPRLLGLSASFFELNPEEIEFLAQNDRRS